MPTTRRMGDRIMVGHLWVAIQFTCPGCWERSERNDPKKNCMPKAAAEGQSRPNAEE